jgi:outer membrane receptor for ferrienterochelin and colicin
MSGLRRSRGIAPLLSAFLAVAVVLIPCAALAQGKQAEIVVKVVDVKEANPLPYANVTLLGTSWGAMTDDTGTAKIPNLPAGTYQVRVQYIGFETGTIENVKVDAGATVELTVRLKETVATQVDEIVVLGEKQLLQKESATTRHLVEQETFESAPVDNLEEAVALKAGVVAQAGELHFRGGRSGEVLYQVDGVPVRDPLSGGGVDIASLALAETEVLLGGLDAKYGNAQSGIINLSTKEGGPRFGGELRFLTDDYGAPDKTYDNYDRVFVGMGGPMPIKDMTYYWSAQGTFTDTYLRTKEVRPSRKLLDFISLKDRQNNSLNLQGKLAWRPSSAFKLTGEYIDNRQKYDLYRHMWSREGWVQAILDTSPQGEVFLRYGNFSEQSLDSSYVYYNAPEHTPNYKDNYKQFKLVFKHTLSPTTYYDIKLSHQVYDYEERVLGKEPWQYSGRRLTDFWINYDDYSVSQFYVTNGDFPAYTRRYTKVETAEFEFTRKYRNHLFQWGAEGLYNDLSLNSVDFPWITSGDGTIGVRSDFHYYNPEGSFFLQDRWEHEGMILNLGLRYDIFSVGQQIDISEVRDRVKSQWSPRLGIAYPISDRDVFSFHYGKYYQIPERTAIFENRGVFNGRTRGNPNLTNQTTVSYQAGVQHLFNDILFGQFSVYYKDIFGLLAVQDVRAANSAGLVSVFVNRDYASSKGFELSLVRRFKDNFSSDLSYTFGVASGVASDPRAQDQQSFLYLPISEQPLDWDQRHTLSANIFISQSEKWGATFVWQYGTGFPYTPIQRNTRELDPSFTNSRRLPSTTTLDLQAEAYYKVWQQDFKVFLQANNMLDARNIVNLEPSNWPLPAFRDINDYDVYYTETGRAGGAYLGPDQDEDGVEDWVPVQDPRVFGEGRVIRVGLGLIF